VLIPCHLTQALSKLGFTGGSKLVETCALAASNRKDFDGQMITIQFLDSCMHSTKLVEVGSHC